MKFDELMSKSLEEIMEPVIDAMPAEKLLRRIAPEQRLDGLSREQLAKALDALSTEQLAGALDALSPEGQAELRRRGH